MPSSQNAFVIDLFRTPDGLTEHSFILNSEWVQGMDQDLLENVQGKADLKMDKGLRMINLTIDLHAEVGLLCDRSLEPFKEQIHVEEAMYYKFGEEFEEQDDNLIILPRDQELLILDQLLFDLVVLALPVKKVHPDYQNQEAIFYKAEDRNKSQQNDKKEQTAGKQNEKKEKPVDPRWEELLKLKNKNDGTS